MKRLLIIFICVALLGSLCIPVLGASEADPDLSVTVNDDGTTHFEESETRTSLTTRNNTVVYRTLVIKVPDHWITVNVYTWEPEDLGSFPGSPARKAGDIYWITIKTSMQNLRISGQSTDGSYRVVNDITLTSTGGDVTVEVRDDLSCIPTYKNPPSESQTEEAEQSHIYRVVGSADWMGYWAADNPLGIMTEIYPGVYRKTYYDVEPGSYALKITRDGSWEYSYGTEDGQNFQFTVDTQCNITIDFTLKGNIGVIEVYGPSVPGTSGGDDDPSDPMPPPQSTQPTEPATPPVTQPTEPVTPPVTQPGSWYPSSGAPSSNSGTSSSTQSSNSGSSGGTQSGEAVGSEATQSTPPVDPDSEVSGSVDPLETTLTTQTHQEQETHSTVPSFEGTDPVNTDATQSVEPGSSDSEENNPSPLVNQPLNSMYMFLFGIICVFAYMLFLIARRSRIAGEVNPDGTVQRRIRLSTKAVTNAVKENMPSPSDALDQSVLEAIQNAKKPPTEP